MGGSWDTINVDVTAVLLLLLLLLSVVEVVLLTVDVSVVTTAFVVEFDRFNGVETVRFFSFDEEGSNTPIHNDALPGKLEGGTAVERILKVSSILWGCEGLGKKRTKMEELKVYAKIKINK